MTYDAREISVALGEPVEIYTFELSGRIYRVTTAEEDVDFVGYSYHALAGLSRGPITLMQMGKIRELPVKVPRTHPLAAAFMGNGIPPRTATLLLQRFHRDDTQAIQIWDGDIANAKTGGEDLLLRVPNRADAAILIGLPFAKVSGLCQHVLYGDGCLVDRNYAVYITQGFMVACSAVTQVGSLLTVDNMNSPGGPAHPAQWARYGEVRRVVDGERRTIVSHIGTALTLDVPFGTILAGDDLEVYAGCDHTISICNSKFSNKQRFGGHPWAPSTNPMNIQDDD